MSKNRKNQSAAIRLGPAIKAFGLCLIIGGAGIGYLWQKSLVTTLGQEIGHREQKLNQLKDQNEKFKRQLAELRSPTNLARRAVELGLGIPHPSQVIRLPEPGATPPAPAAPPALRAPATPLPPQAGNLVAARAPLAAQAR